MRAAFYPVLFVLLLVSSAVSAQRRSVRNTVVIPELQAEWALKDADYFLVGLNVVGNSNGDNSFTGGQLRLGYEHFWNERWSGGATVRLLRANVQNYGDFFAQDGNVIPGVFLRHAGKIGSVNFGQRLGVEYGISTNNYLAVARNRALTRLRLDVDRTIALGENVSLRPRIAYEAAAYLRLQRDENEREERVIDFGNLRGEVGVRLSPRVDITPWVAAQTYYANFVPQYDPITGEEVYGGRTNVIVPVIGLDARFTLFHEGGAAERRQLPSQH